MSSFLCAVIVGVGAYVAFDSYLQDSYTAKVNLRVLPRDNNSAKLAEGNVNSAAVRNVNVLNSDTMKEMIKNRLRQRALREMYMQLR